MLMILSIKSKVDNVLIRLINILMPEIKCGWSVGHVDALRSLIISSVKSVQ